MISKEQLHACMPSASLENLEKYAGPLSDAMEKFEINTPIRCAMFLAQLAHESGCLKYNKEIASGEAYEGRRDLGNLEKGDGVKYKGRGPIQITGRANYTLLTKALGVDFVLHPELLEGPVYGSMAAAWFWKTRGLNEIADIGDFIRVTKRINGGLNGIEDRQRYYGLSKKVFGVSEHELP